MSTAGLIYGPGSYEGHRIKHILKHAEDIPDRRGPHGVFDGGRERILALLDEAYLLVKKNSPQVRKNVEGDRTIYKVDFKRRIGYVGGSTGKRTNHPPANYVQMVLENREVITAYPTNR